MRTQIIFICSFVLLSCKSQPEGHYELLQLDKHKEVFNIGDSIFFNDVTDIVFHEDEYCIVLNNQLYVFDEHLRFLRTVGNNGRGPGEYVYPQNIFIKEDELYITDAGRNKIILYEYQTGFSEEWELADRYYAMYRFTMDDSNNFYFSSPLGKPIHKVVGIKTVSHITNFGDFIQYENEREGFVNNFNHIVYHKGHIISVSTTHPIVKFYDLEGNLIHEYTLPKSFFAHRLRLKANDIRLDNQNKFKEYILIRDVYLHRDNLYLLITENIGGDFDLFVNKVIVVALDKEMPTLKSIIKLPGTIYTAIGVGDDFLVGFDTHIKSLHMVALPSD